MLLGCHLNSIGFAHTRLSLSAAALSNAVLLTYSIFFSINLELKLVPQFEGEDSDGPTTPTGKPIGLGFSAFARRYLQNLFDFFSSGYLDVSVHRVTSSTPMYSAMSSQT